MSDYLNSLVSRTLRLGPVVQPRLASFFEPVSAGPVNEPVTEVSETRLSRETVPQPVQVTAADLPVRNRETNIESRPANESGLHSMPAPLLPAPAMPAPVLSLNTAEGMREVVRDDSSPRAAGSDSITSASETHSDPTPSRLKPEVRIVTNREQVQLSQTTPPAILTFAPPPAPSTTRNVNAQASAPAEAPESVVVTIGRVDVRAVFAAPAPAPRANHVQHQAMSLDEYLKQRSEGRR